MGNDDLLRRHFEAVRLHEIDQFVMCLELLVGCLRLIVDVEAELPELLAGFV